MRLVDMTVGGFLDELASDSPAPGGGSVAALSGALAAALCGMVSRLTLAREKYRDAWPEMQEMRGQAEALGRRLRELVDEDTEAFSAVMEARRLPRASDADKEARERAVQEAVLRSARAPLEVLATLVPLAELSARAVERGNPGCLTDAGTAGQLVRAAAWAAAFNVHVNLSSLVDRKLAADIAAEAAAAVARVGAVAGRLEELVRGRLGF